MDIIVIWSKTFVKIIGWVHCTHNKLAYYQLYNYGIKKTFGKKK